MDSTYLCHHGIKGMHWGIIRKKEPDDLDRAASLIDKKRRAQQKADRALDDYKFAREKARTSFYADLPTHKTVTNPFTGARHRVKMAPTSSDYFRQAEKLYDRYSRLQADAISIDSETHKAIDRYLHGL